MTVYYVQMTLGPAHAPQVVHAVIEAKSDADAITKACEDERTRRGKLPPVRRIIAHRMPPGFRIGRSRINALRKAQAIVKGEQ